MVRSGTDLVGIERESDFAIQGDRLELGNRCRLGLRHRLGLNNRSRLRCTISTQQAANGSTRHSTRRRACILVGLTADGVADGATDQAAGQTAHYRLLIPSLG